MAVDTKFKLAGSKMYTVRKHVCVNCDGGKSILHTAPLEESQMDPVNSS